MVKNEIALMVYELLLKVEDEQDRLTLEDIKDYYERKGTITIKQREAIADINLKILKKCKGVENGKNTRNNRNKP